MLRTRSPLLLTLALLSFVTFATTGCEELGLDDVDLGLDEIFADSTPDNAPAAPPADAAPAAEAPVAPTVVDVPAYPFDRLLAPTAPPAPLAEEAVKPMHPRTEIWRAGYWTYNGHSFDWTPGELVQRPSPTAIWIADHWIQHSYGWAFVAGYWQ